MPQSARTEAATWRHIASGANTHFTYGLFESAIAHFHRTLHRALERAT